MVVVELDAPLALRAAKLSMIMTPTPPPTPSPHWNTPTKFLVALVFIVIIGWLLQQFQGLVGPLALTFILAYLLNPLVERLAARTGLSHGTAVNIVYLALALILIGILTAAGIAIEQQIEGLYRSVLVIANDLPQRIPEWLSQTISIGPFTFNLAETNLDFLYEQLRSAAQPALTQVGGAAGTVATSTASAVAWTLFVLLISYYLSHDVRKLMPTIEQLVPPDYAPDVRRLAAELGPIWNAFLRGQVTLSLSIGVMVGVALTLLGVRFGPVLGLLSFVAEFIPYVGPTSAALTGTLIAFFQGGNWYGLPPLTYAVIVFVTYAVLQQIQGNVLYPRIMGQSLDLHPIIILVGALVMAQLIGFAGLIMSAPLIATLRLFGRYAYRKLFDLDPFPEPPPQAPKPARKFEWPKWLKWPPKKAVNSKQEQEAVSSKQ
jgi:predicted PurR-regulated permease PerM